MTKKRASKKKRLPNKRCVKSPIAHDVVALAIEDLNHERKSKLSLRTLSTMIDVSYAGVWFSVNKRKPWNADKWLGALKALGCLTYNDDEIIISSKALREHAKYFADIERI